MTHATATACILYLLCGTGCTVTEFIGAVRDTDAAEDPADTSPSNIRDTESEDIIDSEDAPDTLTPDTRADETILRIPFTVADNAPLHYLWVDGATNSEGIQGQWFSYMDPLSINQIRNEGDGSICTRGEVAPWQGTGFAYAGMGFNLCNNGPGRQPIYEAHTFGDCPFISDLADRFIGVQVTVRGYPLPGIDLQFKNPASIHPPYHRLQTEGTGDHTFENAILPPWIDTAAVEDVNSIQFHITSLTDTSIPFDFCVSDVHILMKP